MLMEAASTGTTPHASRDSLETDYVLGVHDDVHQDTALASVQRLWNRAIVLQHLAEHGRTPAENATPQEFARASIARLRSQLRVNQRQPLLWSELARHYVILGEESRAVLAMNCALHLARGHGYITRAAARLYVHLDDNDQALDVIRRSPSHRSDPRLLASEITLSSGGRISGAWHAAAKRILEDANHRPTFVGELRAALATVELANGKHKRARQLFSDSLEHPSENSLAQAQWAKERDSKIEIPAVAWSVPGSDEARAMAARVNRNWDDVLLASEMWLAEEPFSAHPAALASFASFSFEQNVRSERIATQALAANPDDALLLNNRSVARSYQGNISGALEDVCRALEFVPVAERNDPVLFATLGLAAYRGGDRDTGRSCYAQAIELLVKERQPRAAALGALFWLREEFRVAPGPETDQIFESVKKSIPKIVQGTPSPEIASMLDALERERVEVNFRFSEATVIHAEFGKLADLYLPERTLDATPSDPVTSH